MKISTFIVKKVTLKNLFPKKKNDLNFKLQTIRMEAPTVVIKEKKVNKKDFNNC